MVEQNGTTNLPTYSVTFGTMGKPCGRTECGTRLLCCRPDCPLVTVDVELGLKRIYTRTEFVAILGSLANHGR